MSWLSDASANRINKAYIKNFFDLSGNLKVRNDGDVIVDISNNQLTMIEEKQIPGDSYSIASTGGITRTTERSSWVDVNDDGSVMIVGHQLGFNSDGIKNGTATVWTNTSGSTWTQKGSLLEVSETDHGRFQGPIEHTYGWPPYITSDGNRILVGWRTGDTTNFTGLYQVYDYVNSDWEQVGNDIVGGYQEQIRDGKMSKDGTTVMFQSAGANYLRFVQYNSSTDTWDTLSTITNYSNSSNHEWGRINGDGTIFAGNNSYSGDYSLKVWKYANNSWSQLGQTLSSTETNEYFQVFDINKTGNIIVTGDQNSYTNTGVLRVYEYNSGTSQWTQLGSDITNSFPYHEAMNPMDAEISDEGNVLVASDYLARGPSNIGNEGGVVVYAYINNAWSQLYILYGGYHNAQAGYGVTMSGDGSRFIWGSSSSPSPAKTYSITRSTTTQPKTMTIEDGKSVVNGTNWINREQSGASVASAYQGGLVVESSGTSASNGVLHVETAGQVQAFSIRENGDLYSDNTIRYSSDDRRKIEEQYITNGTETIKKLSPQIYTKLSDLEQNGGVPIKTESGLIAQEVYYNAPELCHLVRIEDSTGKRLLPREYDLSGNDIQNDPDYTALGWGNKSATVDYIGLLPYLIKSNQEQDVLIKERQTSIDEHAQLIQQFQDRVTALENK